MITHYYNETFPTWHRPKCLKIWHKFQNNVGFTTLCGWDWLPYGTDTWNSRVTTPSRNRCEKCYLVSLMIELSE